MSVLRFTGSMFLLTVFIAFSAFTKTSRKIVSGGGIASGNIRFNFNALSNKGSKTGNISYGTVSAPVECVAVSSSKKMATIYFSHCGSILGITIVDGGEGKNASADLISDPFIVDEMNCAEVLPQDSYNTVTS